MNCDNPFHPEWHDKYCQCRTCNPQCYCVEDPCEDCIGPTDNCEPPDEPDEPTTPTPTTMKKPRKELIKALAYCVESLSNGSLMESSGAIKEAINCDPSIWNYLDDRTIEILTTGLGYEQPPQ